MEKLKMKSLDVIGTNIDKIAQLFPNCVTEHLNKDGKVEFGIDFEKLKAELSNEIIEEGAERYQFTWPDKRKANQLANIPTTMTLRPCREESVDFENTENLYIEGDNLDVLKVLRETYLGKVKMIYIDPPYNTGNDFVYNDDFSQNKGEFEQMNGLFDEEGNQTIDAMQRNTESNGRFHTDWLNMIYPRLKVARDLLSDNGVIFISIDDNEVENLRKVCDEIFGAQNFVDALHWKKKKQPSFLARHTAKVMEYVIVYAKSKWDLEKLSIETLSDATKKVINISNPECVRHFKEGVRVKLGDSGIIQKGRYRIKTMDVEYLSDIHYVNGYSTTPVDVKARFSVGQTNIDKYIDEGLLFITANYGLRRDVSEEEKNNRKSITDLLLSEYGDNQESDKEFLDLFDSKYFDYTKPIALIYNFIKSNYTQGQYVLDFFSGSATTAHAVMQLNAEDGGKRKFIMVQLPEKTDEKSEAFKAGYKNICEIGKERIRRAGNKIKEELGEKAGNLDTGFRVLKLDTSNMEDVYYTPQEFTPKLLFEEKENIKQGRTNEDLLFQVMLDLGIELSAKIESKQIAGKEVYFVEDNFLIACFDKDVNETTITEIAKLKPVYFIMRDASASNDNVIDNFEQIFKHYSLGTDCRII
ncbi:MAG: site-specific DNA-methyltransferase [Bacteroidales bacterium]|nr:site-specific DNA-methyltransferase [Bacteroidales bacterium]